MNKKNKRVGKVGALALAGVMMLSGGLMFIKDYKSSEGFFRLAETTTDENGEIIKLTEPIWESKGKNDALSLEVMEKISKDPTITNLSNIDLYGYFVVDVPVYLQELEGYPEPKKLELFTITDLSTDATEIGTAQDIKIDDKDFKRHYFKANEPIKAGASFTAFNSVTFTDLDDATTKKVASQGTFFLKIKVTAIGVQVAGNALTEDQSVIESYLVDLG